MLVLSCKCGESVIISTPLGPVECVVHRVDGKHVRLGFVAPLEIVIDRKAVYESKMCNLARGEIGGEGG
jgi:carbon storage regulator CsrA